MPDQTHTDPLAGLLEAIAERVATRTRGEIEDVVAIALADAIGALGERAPAGGGQLVRGIDPHKLYTADFVAGRWDYSSAYVRNEIPEEKLPRTPWQGGTPRYRGVDILRFEGVPEEELRPRNIRTMESAAAEARATKKAPPAPGARPAANGSRIYNQSLPKL